MTIIVRKDKDILKDLQAEIASDSRIDNSNLDILIDSGIVTLTGTVSSFKAKEAATEDANSILGVLDVVNKIDVEYNQNLDTPSDSVIRERIDSKISWDPELMTYKINVDVQSGIVNLEGNVSMFWQKTWAEELAKTTFGVISVKNSLVVSPKEDITDESTANSISNSLQRKLPKVELDNIDVKVDSGVVTFTGKVNHHEAWSNALDTARNTTGVVKIVDSITLDSKQG